MSSGLAIETQDRARRIVRKVEVPALRGVVCKFGTGDFLAIVGPLQAPVNLPCSTSSAD